MKELVPIVCRCCVPLCFRTSACDLTLDLFTVEIFVCSLLNRLSESVITNFGSHKYLLFTGNLITKNLTKIYQELH